MTIKEQLRGLLEENRGSFISGEIIAKRLYCTRGAVWKAIKALRSEGLEITAITNRGYCLNDSGDILSESGIRSNLSRECDVFVLKSVNSTNAFLRGLAQSGAEEGTLVLACEQTNGCGRRGRKFFSPADTGIYMSILLRPGFSAQEAVKITAAAAVAVCLAVEKTLDISLNIKWVNDIYLNDKKVAGILTEASMNIENGLLDYAVVGIGLNVYNPENGYPPEISGIAGAQLKERLPITRNKLAAEIYNNFMDLYEKLPENIFLEEYQKRLMWKNERIFVLSGADGKVKTPAVMLGVDESCALKVRYDDNSEGIISSGEISIRR